ncbi:hypothetical protein DPMN_164692 [Dreissena polymorpha]|uniref:Uncharacterized protein n=1 Tax=Dreissena polymorpha TaxID=45954 RepID=A0A9D4EZ02_DREPO|nr:hypothetical protein DPMN_164692 [Dreissena polymorpha]
MNNIFFRWKRAREAQSGTDIPGVKARKCCALMCTTFFTIKEVEEMREEYWTVDQADQRKYLKRAIRDARGSYSLHGRGACEEALLCHHQSLSSWLETANGS